MQIARILAVLFLVVLGTACQTKKDRAEEFVAQFNAATIKYFPETQLLRGVSARLKSENEVEIFVDVMVDTGSVAATLMNNYLPTVLELIVTDISEARNLIKEGVVMKGYIRNQKDKTNLKEMTINKGNYQDFMTKNKPTGPGDKAMSSKEKDLQLMLTRINQQFPIVDKENDVVIAKVTLENGNTLVYNCIVGELYIDIYSIPNAEQIFKEAILESPMIKDGFKLVEPSGITGITYLYADAKGKELLKINFTAKEIRGF
jgi:hypothetical protein